MPQTYHRHDELNHDKTSLTLDIFFTDRNINLLVFINQLIEKIFLHSTKVYFTLAALFHSQKTKVYATKRVKKRTI